MSFRETLTPAGSRRPVLSVRRLRVEFEMPGGVFWRRPARFAAVDDVHLDLFPGETLGIVGESGCGKSTLARAIVGLEQPTRGQILIDGRNVTGASPDAWRQVRGRIQMIFQDPVASLDPRMTIIESVEEPLRALRPDIDARERRRRALALLERVGIEGRAADCWPHEFSGGQCQRVGIARALISEPKILVCDEPVSSLDVSIQAQIINLLRELQAERGLAMLFIAHDLAVVRHICQRVMVMYLGRVMETGSRDQIFRDPGHPYTRALLASIPALRRQTDAAHRLIAGELPDPAEPPSGCVFRTRCPMADAICAAQRPLLRRARPASHAACHFASMPEPASA